MENKMRFIRKNGRVIPIGGSGKKREVKIKAQKRAISNRKKVISRGKTFGLVNSVIGAVGGASLGRTVVEKAVIGAAGALAGLTATSLFVKKHQRKLKRNEGRLKKTLENR